MKQCSDCSIEKPLEGFPIAKTCKDGRRSYCKDCYRIKRRTARQRPEAKEKHRKATARWAKANREKVLEIKAKNRDKYRDKYNSARNLWRKKNAGRVNADTARRRARKLQAQPEWADKKEIKYIYSLAKERGLVVDHIVPLRHPLVCGLHVPANLRCITKELNEHKGNRYWPDMPAGG